MTSDEFKNLIAELGGVPGDIHVGRVRGQGAPTFEQAQANAIAGLTYYAEGGPVKRSITKDEYDALVKEGANEAP